MRIGQMVTFDSVEALLLRAEQGPKPEERYSRKNGKDWAGTASFAEAARMVRNGWPEGRQLMEDGLLEIEVETQKLKEDFLATPDVAGSCVDMGKFVTGEPEDMISFPSYLREGPGRILEVCINLGHGCWDCASNTCSWAKAAEYVHKGVAIISLLQALEKQGFDLEVFGLGVLRCSGYPDRTVAFPIHRADEYWDWDKAAFCLMNAAMMRRLIFGVYEVEFGNRGGVPIGNYGKNGDVFSGSDIYIPSSRLQFTDNKMAAEWLGKNIKSAMKKGVVN